MKSPQSKPEEGIYYGLPGPVKVLGDCTEPQYSHCVLVEIDGMTAMWCRKTPPPEVGSRVQACPNGYGPGIVESYFIEAGAMRGWLGVKVKLDTIPVSRESDGPTFLFGQEIRPIAVDGGAS